MRASLAIGCTVLAAATAAAWAADVSIPVTIQEPAGVARTREPAAGGVPFMKGQVRDLNTLQLVDENGKPVEAAFSQLAGYPDGSVQWALVETMVMDLPANGSRQFKVVGGGEPVVRELPRTISDTANKVMVSTGVRLEIRKYLELGFTDLSYEGLVFTGSSAFKLVGADGKAYSAGPPRVRIERQTDASVTLRLDGEYVDMQSHPFLGYTTRITLWTGSSQVRISHSIRNSNAKAGFDAKVKNATFSLSLPPAKTDRTAGANWLGVGNGKAGVLIAVRHSGGCFPGGSAYSATPSQTLYRQTVADGTATVHQIPPADTEPLVKRGGLYGYDKEGGAFVLADCAHKDTEIWLDFYSGSRDAADNEARAKALRCPLHVLADGAWISRTQTLGTGHFGTLADEIDTYKAWGWKGWDDPKKQPKMPHQPDAYVAKEVIHFESETDSAEGYVLMYVRTGERGYLDWARAWAEFGKTHYAYRTDGFAFNPSRPTTGLKVGWYGPKEYGWSDSRSEYCHFYGRGIFDYYCLTGDVDALEGGRDLVEQCAAWSAKYKPGGAIGYYGCRGFARIWLPAVRLAQLTGEPADRELADRMAQVALTASDWDDRGFIFWGAGPGYMASHQFAEKNIPATVKQYMADHSITIDAKGMVHDKDGNAWPLRSDGGTWQQTTLQMALERHHRLTGNEQAKVRAVRMAEFARDYQISTKCRQAFYYTILDFPAKNRVFDMADFDVAAHTGCPAEGGPHSGHYTRFFPDVFARAYSLTGQASWLEHAKSAWNYGSKRSFNAMKQSAANDEVFIFAYHNAPKDDTVLATARMFYEVTHGQ